MPMLACTKEEKIRSSYRPKLFPDGGKMVHFVYTISARLIMPRNRLKSSYSCGKTHDSGYKHDISFNALNGEIIPGMYSDEYEFDANEYQE
jgi:hypothetical protein